MATSFSDLASQTAQLNDEELLSRYAYASLTDEALAITRREIDRRGLRLPTSAIARKVGAEEAGDYELVARFLNPTDAHLAHCALEAARIPSIVADANLVQTNSLWAIAIGGARLLVPARRRGEAEAVLAAVARGDFALSDDDPAAS
jgi:hypothetical protein